MVSTRAVAGTMFILGACRRAPSDRRTGEQGQGEALLEFVSAWVELYEEVDGAWRMTGNVPDFR